MTTKEAGAFREAGVVSRPLDQMEERNNPDRIAKAVLAQQVRCMAAVDDDAVPAQDAQHERRQRSVDSRAPWDHVVQRHQAAPTPGEG